MEVEPQVVLGVSSTGETAGRAGGVFGREAVSKLRKRLNRPVVLILLLLAILAAAIRCLSVIPHGRPAAGLKDAAIVSPEIVEHGRTSAVHFSESKVPSGIHFVNALRSAGLDQQDTVGVATAAQSVFDLRHLRAGNALSIGRSSSDELRSVRYQIDAEHMLWIIPQDAGFHAEIKTIPSHTEVAGFTGHIRDSLFNAVTDAGESPELAMRLSEIFGWDLDFYTDPRSGDSFRVLVERKKNLDGHTVAYGRILAAEYNNDGHTYQAVLFRDPSGQAVYYQPDGKSLEKAFLRSPLKFAAPITSHFSRDRYHPVLKVHRPHLGIDYKAPVGAPVQAIGSGRVVFAGRKGGAGNLVQLQHANGYETMYMHLSRLLVRSGQRVEQGQAVGLVGMTGLATGPHLDFRILQNGAYRNFEKLQLPPALPVAEGDWDDFVAAREHWLPLLADINALQTVQSQPKALTDAGDPSAPGSSVSSLQVR